MQEWKEYKLNELGRVNRGKSKFRPRNEPSLYGGMYPFIQTGDIKAANFYITEYSQTYNEKGLAQSKLWKKGTLCITIAANIAESAILGIDACFPDSIIGFIADEKKSDVRFIKYHFDLLKLHLQSISQGTTQDNLSQEKLLRFTFTVPDLKQQQLIASIISSYDELIEVNTERIKQLEKTARELYKEWFVRMRFPEYDKTKFKKGLPDGWEIKKLGEISELINRGISPDYDENGGSLVLNQRCVRDNRIYFDVARRQNKNIPSNKLILRGDVLINSTGEGTLGRTAQFNDDIENLTADSHLTIARPKERFSKEYYGMSVCSFENYFELMALGSTGQTELGRKVISDVLIKIPTNKILERFSNIVRPMNELIVVLIKQNIQLRQIRDRLLPRLISGKLLVSVSNKSKQTA
jgi:type I restriction enzyme S subunit